MECLKNNKTEYTKKIVSKDGRKIICYHMWLAEFWSLWSVSHGVILIALLQRCQVSSKTRKMTPCNHLHTINSCNVFKIREFLQNTKPVLKYGLSLLGYHENYGEYRRTINNSRKQTAFMLNKHGSQFFLSKLH